MIQLRTTVIFSFVLNVAVLGQKNEEFTSSDIKYVRWSFDDDLRNFKIGDTVVLKKSSKKCSSLKFKLNRSIVEFSMISDYTGEHFKKNKCTIGEWKIEDKTLLIKNLKSSYQLDFIGKNKNSLKFKLKNIYDT